MLLVVRVRSEFRPVVLPMPSPEEVHRMLYASPEEIPDHGLPPEQYVTSLEDWGLRSPEHLENLMLLRGGLKRYQVMRGQTMTTVLCPVSPETPICVECAKPLPLYVGSKYNRCPRHRLLWEWTQNYEFFLRVHTEDPLIQKFVDRRRVQLSVLGLDGYLSGNTARVLLETNRSRALALGLPVELPPSES